MAGKKWGITSYRRSDYWVREDGRKGYVGCFLHTNCALLGYSSCSVHFWAKRPILALREIVNSGRDPVTFTEQTIN